MAKDHVVRQGECILSIADQEGFFWETLWNDPNNSDLRSERDNPNVLMPGDVVHVRDKQEKSESGATEQKHRFRRKGQPGKLRLRLIKRKQDDEPQGEGGTEQDAEFNDDPQESTSDEPRADTPYVLYVDGVWIAEGQTDSDGRLEQGIPAGAQDGKLVLEPGTENETSIELSLRKMDPINELMGVCKRLINLGFDCPLEKEEVSPKVSAALRAFQKKNGLQETGKPDQATRDALVEQHGG